MTFSPVCRTNCLIVVPVLTVLPPYRAAKVNHAEHSFRHQFAELIVVAFCLAAHPAFCPFPVNDTRCG